MFCLRSVERNRKTREKQKEQGTKKTRKIVLASLDCSLKNGTVSKDHAKKILKNAKDKAESKKSLKTLRKCPKPYTPPKDAVIDNSAFGPLDPNDIQNDPIKYVRIRANQIWATDPKLFNNTTAGVTIVECGLTRERKVILTSCVEGPNVHKPLERAANVGEILVPPDPIVHRVRHTEEEGKIDAKFIARRADSTPAKTAGIENHADYDAAERSMSAREPKYTVCSEYPGADPNETHAEQRAVRWAAANGCTVVAQAPTIGCCDECRKDLGADGLSKVPLERRSADAYNEYRRTTLVPTLDASQKTV